MARRKLSPEDQQAHDLESLRVHAFLFCQEAGLPRGTLLVMPAGTLRRYTATTDAPDEKKLLHLYRFMDPTGNYGIEYEGQFADCEAWICAARNGLRIVDRHDGLKKGGN